MRGSSSPLCVEALRTVRAAVRSEIEVNGGLPDEEDGGPHAQKMPPPMLRPSHWAVLVLASLLIASPGHWLYRTGDLSLASDSGAP